MFRYAIFTVLIAGCGRAMDVIPSSKNVNFSGWDQGSVLAEGGWRSHTTKLFVKVQSAYVYCNRDQRECRLTLAQLVPEGSRRRLTISNEFFAIDRWDTNVIRASLDYQCARYELLVNRAQESVEEVRTTTSSTSTCSHMDTEPIRLELYDPY